MNPTRSLFGPPPASEQILLDEQGCRVRFWERFLSVREASDLFVALMAMAPLEPETVVLASGPILTRRKSCAFGEPGLTYRYVGATRHTNPWPVELVPVLERIREVATCRFDFALCGLYLNGEADLGYHGDDETDLELGAPIASLSLGAERDFVMRWGESGLACLTVPLNAGSLLTMQGRCQELMQHGVPKRLRCREPRLNLTFRRMKTGRPQ